MSLVSQTRPPNALFRLAMESLLSPVLCNRRACGPSLESHVDLLLESVVFTLYSVKCVVTAYMDFASSKEEFHYVHAESSCFAYPLLRRGIDLPGSVANVREVERGQGLR